ncbi:MAG: T9SS type A sorting domain-containing protein [Ignavibacteria bacterium]|nr:T9SS type A sorting domain-containing protein [Ignavibacteria bacterium]
MPGKSVKFRLFLALLILVTVSSQIVQTQPSVEWVKRYNGTANRFDIVTTMKVDINSNAIVYGNVNLTGTFSDIAAIKYSSSGAVLWQAVFNGYSSQLDECKDAYLDAEGNSYITGFTSDTNQVVKIVTLKINSAGSILWSKVFLPPVYNQGFGLSITKDNQGNIYTCGSVRRANGTNSIALIKYSANGELLASTFFNKTASSSETPVTVCTDNAGSIYILASSNAIGGVNDILMLKFSSTLSLRWQYTFSGTAFGNDMPVKMLYTQDNKLAVTAAVYNSPGNLDYGIYRFDTSSALIMQYHYNGSGNDQDIPYDITSDSANNVYVTGSSRNYDTLGSEDIYTMKIDPTAFLLWEKRYNGSGKGLDYGTSVTVDNRGNVFVGGTTDKHDFHQQYALLKFSPTGDFNWLEEYSVIENSEDFVYTAIADNQGSVYVTGISFDSTTDYDIATIKYSEPIGIEPINNEVPEEYMLYQNYPNPFNPTTKIVFQIPLLRGVSGLAGRGVLLSVYNVLGKQVAVLVNSELPPGTYEAEFDGSNLPSGVYFCNLETEGFSKSIKIMLIK